MLLNQQKGFGVGPTIHACTKGLWIWLKPIAGFTPEGDPINILVMDTEGLGALDEDSNHDTKIFSLALLLSSFFIYNSVGSIDESALQNLSLVINLTKHIHLKSQGDEDIDPEEYARYFPAFMWVVRDFSLKLVNANRESLTDRQYLENSLRLVDSTDSPNPEQIASRNEIRGKLTTFFKERDCVTLVRPVSDEKNLRMIDKLPYETLRPEFRSKMELLVKKVFNNIQPKIIDGQPLTGEMFASLLKEYIAAFNSGAVPAIQTSWEQVLNLELDRVIGNAVDEYRTRAAELSINHLPMSEEELKKIDEEAKKGAYNKFYETGLVNVGAEKMSTAREKMEGAFIEVFSKLRNENYNVSYKDSEELFNKLYERIKEQMDKLEVLTFDVVSTNWQNLKEVNL